MENTNLYKNGIPQFDGQKYAFWSIRMKTYIQAQGFQVWQSIVDGYTAPTVPPTNEKVVKLGENNSKATNALLNGLSDTYSPKLHIVNLLKRFGTSFEIFMKEIQKSKQQSFKLTEVSILQPTSYESMKQ
jgi:hypothetical protein